MFRFVLDKIFRSKKDCFDDQNLSGYPGEEKLEK